MGHPQQSVKTNPLLTTLDFADVNRMQIGFFRQSFLAYPSAVAIFSDRLPKDSQMWFGPRHGYSKEREREQCEHP